MDAPAGSIFDNYRFKSYDSATRQSIEMCSDAYSTEVAAELAAGKTGVLVLDVSRSTLGDCRGLHQELLPVMSHTVPILLLRNHKGWLPAGADLRLVQVLADNCLDIEQIILNVRHLLPLSTRSVA